MCCDTPPQSVMAQMDSIEQSFADPFEVDDFESLLSEGRVAMHVVLYMP